MKVGVYKIAMASPDDVSALEKLIDEGTVKPEEIVAVIGKTEGNGGANDFTRGYATLAFRLMLAKRLGIEVSGIIPRIAFVWSGGTEGVLSPHATVFTRTDETAPGSEGRLVLGIAETRNLLPEEIGTATHVELVADAVRQALKQAGVIDPADVHYVQVKGPLLTGGAIADADARGAAVVTRDPNGSKVFARGAMGLGVALALGEVEEDAAEEGGICRGRGGRDALLLPRGFQLAVDDVAERLLGGRSRGNQGDDERNERGAAVGEGHRREPPSGG